jgi:hypothetical protein
LEDFESHHLVGDSERRAIRPVFWSATNPKAGSGST